MNADPASPIANLQRCRQGIALALLGLIAATQAGCETATPSADEPPDTLVVAVSILPQAAFVHRLDGVNVDPFMGYGEPVGRR